MILTASVLMALCAFVSFQNSYASTIAQVKIPEGASEENSDHFDPATITVAKRTTVEWINDDSTIHTVTSGSPNSGNARVHNLIQVIYPQIKHSSIHTTNKEPTSITVPCTHQ